MNRHQFQSSARQFRAGKISLSEFTDLCIPASSSSSNSAANADSQRQPLPALPERLVDSHKGDYGKLLIVAGSRGMSGAAALTGMAALRSGAGLVTVATAKSCQDVIAGFHPELMTVGLPDDKSGRISLKSWSDLRERVPEFDCLAIGPGLGTSPVLRELIQEAFVRVDVAGVFDADALNNLGGDFVWQANKYPRILTPHPGELGRLVPKSGADRAALELAAIALSQRISGAIVLKGHRSLVTNGQQSRHNSTGNPGMATAGSGDVLTGVIAALVAQGLNAWDAAVLGCHVHGAAGDFAAAKLGQHSMVATDIIQHLSDAFKIQSASNGPST
jgi:NAD(P)H-hydrate epimerase